MTKFIERYLAPFEVENVLKTEQESRRLRRLNQVRQRAKENANKINFAVKSERERQLNNFKGHLEAQWHKNKQQQMEHLGLLYGKNLQEIGQAHLQVIKDTVNKDLLTRKVQTDSEKSFARGRQALNAVREEKSQELKAKKRQNDLRRHTRLMEDERAHQLAKSSHGSDNVASTDQVQHDNAVALSSSIKVIQTAPNNEYSKNDARIAAELEMAQQKEIEQKKVQEKIEQKEKEKRRFFTALSQMELQKEYNRIVNELEMLAKVEEVFPEPDILSHLSRDSNNLKQEQEAIVEELFSRLGLSVRDRNAQENVIASTALSTYSAGPVSSSATSSGETVDSVTPTVHVVIPDLSTFSAIIHSDDQMPVRTLTRLSYEKTTSSPLSASSSQTDKHSYPSGVEASSSDETKLSVAAAVNTISGSDDTILAGHIVNQDKAPPLEISSMASLISNAPTHHDSPYSNSVLLSTGPLDVDHQSLTEESVEHVSAVNDILQHQDVNDNIDKYKTPPEMDSIVKDKPVSAIDVYQEKMEGMPPLSVNNSHLTSPKLVVDASGTELVLPEAKPLNASDSLHLNTARQQSKYSQIGKEECLKKQIKRLLDHDHPSLTHGSDLLANDHEASVVTEIFKTIGFHRADPTKLVPSTFIPLSVNVKKASLTAQKQSPMLVPDVSQTPVVHKPHLIKRRHNLSTILEVETSSSSQQTCWQDSSTLTISEEFDTSSQLFAKIFTNEEPGITDEPDLSLVSSDMSRSSCNDTHTTDTTFRKKEQFFLLNVKTTDKVLVPKDSVQKSLQSSVDSIGLTPSGQLHLSDVSQSINGKTPTISSLYSSLDISNYSQRLHGLSNGITPLSFDLTNEESSRLQAMSLHSKCTMDLCSNLSATESLLSFLMHEQSAELENSVSHCTHCADSNVSSPNSEISSNRNCCVKENSDELLHNSAFSCFSAFGSSESLLSFLKHEESADSISSTSTLLSTEFSNN